jgi:hypothetical protein
LNNAYNLSDCAVAGGNHQVFRYLDALRAGRRDDASVVLRAISHDRVEFLENLSELLTTSGLSERDIIRHAIKHGACSVLEWAHHSLLEIFGFSILQYAMKFGNEKIIEFVIKHYDSPIGVPPYDG